MTRPSVAALGQVALATCLVVLCAPLRADILFTDVGVDAGIGLDLYHTENSHGLGMIWIDYDEDGWADLFLVNGHGHPAHLFHNEQDGTFADADHLLPAINPDLELSGAVYADYDNDGDSDIYIFVNHEDLFPDSNDNPADGPPNILLKNLWVENGEAVREGQPLFEDVAPAAGVDGVVDPPYGTDYTAKRSVTGGWLDYDRDGCIDLYVGQWVIRQLGFESNRDTLYRNNCDGTFSDVTAESGVNDGVTADDHRPTLAFIGAHLDQDTWPDMYVVTVWERGDPQPEPPDTCDPCPPRWHDFFFLNNQDGTFTDLVASFPEIGDDSAAGMGIDVADIDLDGDWDIYISDVDLTTKDALPLGNVFYKSNGDGTWADNSAPEDGVQGRFSWGVNFFDADHDRYEDFYVSVMGVDPLDILYHNNQDGTFTEITEDAGITLNGEARGSAVADFDLDGDLDVAVVERGANLHLLRNDSTDIGNWVKFRLQGDGVASNADAIGALVQLKTGGKRLMRQIKGGSSAHGQDDLVMHFGVGSVGTITEARVFWPSGLEEVYQQLAANTLHTLVEGEGPPDIVKVSPRRVEQGAQDWPMILLGTGFQAGTEVAVIGDGVQVDEVIFVDSGELSITVDVDAAAELGFRRLMVRNPSGAQTVEVAAFQVIAGN